MKDEEIVAQLIQVKEVGRWTPEMFLYILSWKTRCLTRWRSGRKKCDAEDIFSEITGLFIYITSCV